jgi:peptidyl-prolyl cis-trans isomerase C
VTDATKVDVPERVCDARDGAPAPAPERASDRSASSSRHWRRLRAGLGEPLVQFVLIGTALFLGYQILYQGRDPGTASTRIELTDDDLRQMSVAWLAQGRSAPTPEEMRSLVDMRVREEILYREALALGLDKGDTIVKRRLAQKMEFLFEDVSALHEPTKDELRAWFETNADRFARPPRASFRHLYFSPDRRGARAREDAARVLDTLRGKPASAPQGAALADRFMFQDYYGDRSFEEMAKLFGPRFAQALLQQPPGAWRGPIESGYGWHLVWVDSLTPSRVPAFEEVEAEAKTEWMANQRDETRRRAYEAMRSRYEVVLPAPTRLNASAGGAPSVRTVP